MVEFLFHGTTLEYIEAMFERFGCYKHLNGKPVFLAEQEGYAQQIALVRAEDWKGTAAVMCVDRAQVSGLRLEKGEIWPCCDQIEAQTFGVYKIVKRSIDDVV